MAILTGLTVAVAVLQDLLQPELAGAPNSVVPLERVFLVLASAALAALEWVDVAAAYGLGAATRDPSPLGGV